MNLMSEANNIINRVTNDSSNGFAVPVTFYSPASVVVTINAIHTKHHLGVDDDGNIVQSKKATLAFSEKNLLNAGYTIRDNTGQVNLKRHKISVEDSTGNTFVFTFQSWFPDDTIGLITCILEVYNASV